MSFSPLSMFPKNQLTGDYWVTCNYTTISFEIDVMQLYVRYGLSWFANYLVLERFALQLNGRLSGICDTTMLYGAFHGPAPKTKLLENLYAMHQDWLISIFADEEDRRQPLITDLPQLFVTLNDTVVRRVKLAGQVPNKRTHLSAKIRKQIHSKYNNICVYCGHPSEHIDHVIPVSRGGTNNTNNLVAACSSCNHRKFNHLLSELGWTINATI